MTIKYGSNPNSLYTENLVLFFDPKNPKCNMQNLQKVSSIATGGDLIYTIVVGGKPYVVHEFTTVGTSNFVVSSEINDLEYLIVAGGGAGGQDFAGGGGAGGVRSSVSGDPNGGGQPSDGKIYVPPGNYTVTVGAGGSRPTGSTTQGNVASAKGASSSFSAQLNLEAEGGGGGAGSASTNIAGSGGSGGGGGHGRTAGVGRNGQGFSGGSAAVNVGAGGGGAGGAGSSTGAGGPGISSTIRGSSFFVGGGGGGTTQTVNSTGGVGGGGTNSGYQAASNNGEANTGGGGSGYYGSWGGAGNGGSGLVILRYPAPGGSTNIKDIGSTRSTAIGVKGPEYSSDNEGILVFDGETSSSYISVPHSSNFINPYEISLAAWAYLPDWDVEDNMRIVSKTEAGNYNLGINDPTFGAAVGFAIRLSGTYYGPSIDRTLVPAGWHYFCGTSDGRYAKFYMDGVLVDTIDIGFYGTMNTRTNSLLIGSEAVGNSIFNGGSFWNGKIGIIQLYNRAITLAEVNQNFDATKSRYI